jgi:hypothetical protein
MWHQNFSYALLPEHRHCMIGALETPAGAHCPVSPFEQSLHLHLHLHKRAQQSIELKGSSRTETGRWWPTRLINDDRRDTYINKQVVFKSGTWKTRHRHRLVLVLVLALVNLEVVSFRATQCRTDQQSIRNELNRILAMTSKHTSGSTMHGAVLLYSLHAQRKILWDFF